MKNVVILIIACIAAFGLYTFIQNNPSLKSKFDEMIGAEPTVGEQVDQAIDSVGEAVEDATGN